MHIRLAGNRRKPGVNNDQSCAPFPGTHNHLSHVGMGVGRVGAPQDDTAGVLIVGNWPTPLYEPVSEIAPVVALGIVGEVVGAAQRVHKAPGHVLRLSKAHGFALPDTDASCFILLLDLEQPGGDFIQSLFQSDLLPAAGGFLEGLQEPVRMVDHVDSGPGFYAQPPPVPQVFLVAVYIYDSAVFQVYVDRAAVVAHAA
ncbi:hypothetical protein ES703_75418 [subsurface metagenome]